MSGEIVLFIVMSAIFLIAIVLIEAERDTTERKVSAKRKAETISEKCICHSCDYNYTADELKKVG